MGGSGRSRRKFSVGTWNAWSLLSKASVINESSITDYPLVTGRVLKVEIADTFCQTNKQVIYNVHNFELQGRGLSNLCNAVDVDLRRGKENPLKHNVWLIGDFNL